MRKRRIGIVGRVGAGVMLTGVVAAVAADVTALPPAQFPVENQPSDAKRVLGKILFFDAQLSADDTVACATCHVMSHGGTDPRRMRNPGKDSAFGNDGDVFASPGVMAMAQDGTYATRGVFGTARQITPRATPSPFGSNYAPSVLWDGRASGTFVDPVTKLPVIEKGGALESQALLPLVNSAEMGHDGRGFAEILGKLQTVAPLALADRLPSDVAAALVAGRDYPELFRLAFGDPAITAPRIAMAIATYERTLVPNRTDYDRFIAGDATALTTQEQRGLEAFKSVGCAECHTPPLFTDNTFRATGVRPGRDDEGRGDITKASDDGGRFKVPSLRNVALKRSFFHDGRRTQLHEAIKFYARDPSVPKPNPERGTVGGNVGGPAPNDPSILALPPKSSDPTVGYGSDPDEVQFVDNQDPAMADIRLTTQQIDDIEAFLSGGLVDPRVQNEDFPFDRPLLATDHPDLQPQVASPGVEGPTGMPEIVVVTPAYAGNDGFRVGVTGPVGATGRLLGFVNGTEVPTISEQVSLTSAISPDGGVVVVEPDPMSDPIFVIDPLPPVTDGSATVFLPLTNFDPGTKIRLVWQLDAPGGLDAPAASPALDVPVFAKRAMAKETPGVGRDPVDPATVDDGAASVSRVTFRVDRAAHRRGVNRDSFSVVARINPRGAGSDLSQGRLTITAGGAPILQGAALDAQGRLHSPTTDASFNPASGDLLIVVHDGDLRPQFDVVRARGEAVQDVPVEITVAGLGLATPTVSTEIPFTWHRTPRVTSGSFTLSKKGTARGTFTISQLASSPGGDGPVRIQASGVLDAPGGRPFAAPEGLVLRVGASTAVVLDRSRLVVSKKAGTISATVFPTGMVDDFVTLRIDTKRRTITFNVVADDPALVAAPPGTIVPLRIRLETLGAAAESYETVVEVRVP